MNKIKLTQKHKNKLIEMIKKLFPEFVKVEFCVDNSDYDQDEYEKCLQLFIQFDGDGQEWSEIHWFEFCMTHLLEKILNPNPENPTRGLQKRFKEFFWETNLYAMNCNKESLHPIDYLYEEFKLIK